MARGGPELPQVQEQMPAYMHFTVKYSGISFFNGDEILIQSYQFVGSEPVSEESITLGTKHLLVPHTSSHKYWWIFGSSVIVFSIISLPRFQG